MFCKPDKRKVKELAAITRPLKKIGFSREERRYLISTVYSPFTQTKNILDFHDAITKLEIEKRLIKENEVSPFLEYAKDTISKILSPEQTILELLIDGLRAPATSFQEYKSKQLIYY